MRPLRSSCRLLLSTFVVLIFSATVTVAQTTINDQQGFKPFDFLSGGDVDSVSVTNGGLVLHIPLASFRQRGDLDLSFAVSYSGAQWYVRRTTTTPPAVFWTFGRAWMATHPASSMDWWRENSGTVDTSFYMHAISPDGNHHSVSLDDWNSCGVSGTVPTRTLDASGILFPDCNTVVLPSGTRFSYLNSPGFVYLGYGVTDKASQPSSMTDSNGNQVTLTTNGWHDTLGRLIPGYQKNNLIVPGAATSDLSTCPSGTASAEVWNVPDLAGGTRTFKFCYANFSISTNFQVSGVVDYPATNTLLMNAIVLPNLTEWTFSYDNYGNVTRLGLPSGGSISYTYQVLSQSPCVEGDGSALIRVASRAVDANDGSGAHTWTYTYGTGTTTVTSPDGNDAVHTVADPISSTDQCYLYETQAQYFQGSGASRTLLKTVATQYGGNSSPPSASVLVSNVVPIQITTTWANGQSSKTVNTYDPGVTLPSGDLAVFGSLIQRDEYDFSGSLARSTVNHYLWQDNSTYLNNNFLSHLASVTVKDGGGTQVAKSTYGYDEVAVSSSGISTPSLVAPPAGGNIRGNQTTASRWLNTTNSMISSTAAFFDTGMTASGTDPLGHTTTHAYSSAYLGAYRTQTCNPQTNGINHCVSASYDSNTGLETQFTDENGQVTSAQYDLMHHPIQISYPDGGQTTYCFTDTGGAICAQGSAPFSALTTKKINASTNLTSTTKFDGLGRVIQTQLTSVPQGTVFTDTVYDALGRVHSVSNPHVTGSSPTDGITTYVYDALGRTCVVVPPDGTAVSGGKCPATQPTNDVFTSYSGSTTTVTDQAGKSRESVADGLGRLTQVFEDPGSSPHLNFETDYQYDVLNNLLCVVQKGTNSGTFTNCASTPVTWRPRSFSYNSLSQLLTASNPESGTTTYTYDNDGNVQTKIDARNITTTYYYDALNRITAKTYSDGTETGYYFYDTPPSWMSDSTNVKGRLANTSNSSGGSTDGKATAATFSYDAMGRIVRYWQQTPSASPGGYPVYQSYDLAGDVTSATNAAGVAISYAYDPAARPTTVTSNWNDAQHPATLYTVDPSIGYFPSGALRKATLPNGLTESLMYNNRLQPCRMEINSTAASFSQCTDGVPSGNVLDFNYGYNLGSSDNGNVASWSSVGNQTFTRSYVYDSVNRISTLSDTATAQTCKGLSWTIDPWGNRSDQNVTAGSCGTFHATVGTNNRLGSPYQYDAAGNMTNDGTHSYTYDAENHLTQVDAGATASYIYDPNGTRVRKNSGGSWTEYFYDFSGNVTAERNSAGWPVEYVYLGSQLIAQYRDSTTYSIFKDHLGSARLITKLDKSVYDSLDFLPFGEQLSGDTGTTHKFTGKERDSESGLDNFGARYNSSAMGRFMSPDPIYIEGNRLFDPQTLNLYSYVRNNPLNLTDPTGMLVDVNCQQVSAAQCSQTVTDFNNREGAQFQVTRDDKTGQLNVDGNVDPTKLSAGEKALYDSITNKDATGTVTVVGNDSSFDFEKSTGKGQNSVDRSDLNALNGADKRLSGEIIAHAALESYDSAKPGVSVDQAHDFAKQFFGFQYDTFKVGGYANGRVNTLNLNWRAVRLHVDFKTTLTLKTPIPLVTLRGMTTPPPRDVTNVTILPPEK